MTETKKKRYIIYVCEKCGWKWVYDNFGFNLAVFICDCNKCKNQNLKIIHSDTKEGIE